MYATVLIKLYFGKALIMTILISNYCKFTTSMSCFMMRTLFDASKKIGPQKSQNAKRLLSSSAIKLWYIHLTWCKNRLKQLK